MIDRIAERLVKLLLMLSSNHDGEVVAAARAIGRTLKDAGADWHDFATRLLVPAKAHVREYGARNDDTNWREMREFCLQHPERLSQREREFIDSLGRWRGKLTEKQHAWLAAIDKRLRRRHAA
jgi:hypothetical protein